MAKNVYVFLAEGFEEIEAISIIDVLRRAGISTVMVSTSDSLEVAGAHHISVRADKMFNELDFSDADALILPGGLPGVTNLAGSPGLKELILKGYNEGRLIGAICAAPMILGELGILRDREATCYPSFEKYLEGYKATSKLVIQSDHVITAAGVGVAIDFALELVANLIGRETATEIAQAILHQA